MATLGKTRHTVCFGMHKAVLTLRERERTLQSRHSAWFLLPVSWEAQGAAAVESFICFLVWDFEQGLTVAQDGLRLQALLLPQLSKCGDFETCIHLPLGQNGIHSTRWPQGSLAEVAELCALPSHTQGRALLALAVSSDALVDGHSSHLGFCSRWKTLPKVV